MHSSSQQGCNSLFVITNERVLINNYKLLTSVYLIPEQQPCQMSDNLYVGCLCCMSGPLSITLYTDRGGYCPGESIGVSAVINNQSDNDILGLEIHLIQVTVYIASCSKQLISMYWYYKWWDM